jgi:hypothetical protein
MLQSCGTDINVVWSGLPGSDVVARVMLMFVLRCYNHCDSILLAERRL